MISVLALDRSDGWVFARNGGRILLLRPPYRLAEASVVPETVVERAVAQHGYEASESEFATWADIVEFVRNEVAQQRKAEGRTLPDEGVGRAMLRNAPTSTVERFLERIQTDLLPRNDFDRAEEIIRALQIESVHLQESPELSQRTAKLLANVLTGKKERLERLTRDEKRFPRLAKTNRLEAIRKYGEQVARAGSMFARGR